MMLSTELVDEGAQPASESVGHTKDRLKVSLSEADGCYMVII